MALDQHGRVKSLFEMAEEGIVSDELRQRLPSYDPELRDGLKRTLKDIARIYQKAEMLEYLESLPVRVGGARPVPDPHSTSTSTAGGSSSNSPNPPLPLPTRPESKSSQQDINQAMNLILSNRIGVFRIKLNQGLDPNGFSESLGRWLLEEAIMAKKEDVVDALIKAGADVNKVSLTEAQNKTMLMMAVMLDYPPIVRLLLENGADHLARGSNGATALHDACYFGSTQALPVLLPYYKSENYSPSCSTNGYPLQVMIAYPQHEKTEAVIETFKQAGFDFNDPRYSPPLIVGAFKHKRDHLIRSLLLAGADPTAIDASGKSTFDYLDDEQILLLYEVKEWLDKEASTSTSR